MITRSLFRMFILAKLQRDFPISYLFHVSHIEVNTLVSFKFIS